MKTLNTVFLIDLWFPKINCTLIILFYFDGFTFTAFYSHITSCIIGTRQISTVVVTLIAIVKWNSPILSVYACYNAVPLTKLQSLRSQLPTPCSICSPHVRHVHWNRQHWYSDPSGASVIIVRYICFLVL